MDNISICAVISVMSLPNMTHIQSTDIFVFVIINGSEHVQI